MKRICTLLSLAMTISLTGCGSNSGNSGSADNSQPVAEKSAEPTPTPEPLDLTGLWVQEEKDEKETHMSAVIKEDGTIGVFFILENDDTPYTYWIGTYQAPETDAKEYSWVSDNTYGGNGILASSAENKEFSYADEKLSYEVTIQGNTAPISLVRGEWDTSKIPESVFASVKPGTVDLKDLEILDSGWVLKNEKYVYYYVDLYNPNTDIAVEYPAFKITARDKDGVLLGTEDQVLSIIYPEQHFIYGFQAFSVDAMPETVEFEVREPEEYNIKNASAMEPFQPLEVKNTAVRSDKIVGEIYNPNQETFDGVVVIKCKNSVGELVGIETEFVDDISAGGSTPFSASIYGYTDIAEIECYANRW